MNQVYIHLLENISKMLLRLLMWVWKSIFAPPFQITSIMISLLWLFFLSLFLSRCAYILDIVCKQRCNRFGIWSKTGKCLGVALSPEASFFNHSCTSLSFVPFLHLSRFLWRCTKLYTRARRASSTDKGATPHPRRHRIVYFMYPVHLFPRNLLSTRYKDIKLDQTTEMRLEELDVSYHFRCRYVRNFSLAPFSFSSSPYYSC